LYYSKLFGLAKLPVKLDEAAEEITDDVFLNFRMQRNRLTGINNFAFYCCTAIKNKSLMHLSKTQIKKVNWENKIATMLVFTGLNNKGTAVWGKKR
jgi:DNA-directed RNA polymerase specialized sigma24 family protein